MDRGTPRRFILGLGCSLNCRRVPMTVPAPQGVLQAGPEPDCRSSGILARSNCRNCHAPAPDCRMLPRGKVACGNCHSRGNKYGGLSADASAVLACPSLRAFQGARNGPATAPSPLAAISNSLFNPGMMSTLLLSPCPPDRLKLPHSAESNIPFDHVVSSPYVRSVGVLPLAQDPGGVYLTFALLERNARNHYAHA